MLADLNTKSHPSARLVLLRTLWGIEGPDEEIKKVQKVVVKALRVTQGSTARGSNDPLPPERPANEELSSSTSSQSTEDRLNSTLAKLNSREQAVREELDELTKGRHAAGEENRGIRVEDLHKFMYELSKIANERADAFEMAYTEERSLRETVEQRAERLIDFLREAGIFHPRGHEENERNDRIAREEEERRKSLQEEDLRRMLRSGTQKKPPKGPPPIAPASPKAEPKQGRVKEPPQSIGTPPVKGEMARLKALAESIAKEPPGASGIPTTRLAKVEKGNDTPWKIPPAEPKAMVSEQRVVVKGPEGKTKPPPPAVWLEPEVPPPPAEFTLPKGMAKPPPTKEKPKKKAPPPPLGDPPPSPPGEPPQGKKGGYPNPPKALAPPHIFVPAIPQIPQRPPPVPPKLPTVLEEPKKEEPKQEELLKRLQAELREFEEHARFKQNLAERKMVGTGRLLSYEEGFS